MMQSAWVGGSSDNGCEGLLELVCMGNQTWEVELGSADMAIGQFWSSEVKRECGSTRTPNYPDLFEYP